MGDQLQGSDLAPVHVADPASLVLGAGVVMPTVPGLELVETKRAVSGRIGDGFGFAGLFL